jgi:hypothetical protein
MNGGEWTASCPSCFTPGERAPSTHLIGGWVLFENMHVQAFLIRTVRNVLNTERTKVTLSNTILKQNNTQIAYKYKTIFNITIYTIPSHL